MARFRAQPFLPGTWLQTALPQILIFPQALADPTRQHEEEIAQPIHVLENRGVERFLARQRQDVKLSAPAYRAALMQEATDASAAGQDKRFERLKFLLALVDEALDGFDFLVAEVKHPLVHRVLRRRELTAQIE